MSDAYDEFFSKFASPTFEYVLVLVRESTKSVQRRILKHPGDETKFAKMIDDIVSECPGFEVGFLGLV